jgi:hypothetical protein
LSWNVPRTGTPSYTSNATGSVYAAATSATGSTAATYTISGGSAGAGGASSTGTSGAAAPPSGNAVKAAATTGVTTVQKPDVVQAWVLGSVNGPGVTNYNCGLFTADRVLGDETFGPSVQYDSTQPLVAYGTKGADKKPVPVNDVPRHLSDPGKPQRTTNEGPTKSAVSGGTPMASGQNAHHRTLQTSGCGLFALSTALAAYNCAIPGWTEATAPATSAFADRATQATQNFADQNASPHLFLLYLLHYLRSKNSTLKTDFDASQHYDTQGILAPDGPGALYFHNDAFVQALALLLQYHPCQYAADGTLSKTPKNLGITFDTDVAVSPKPGDDVPAITASICVQHQPVIVGVGDTASVHQVLVFGVVKRGGKTYYLAADSGFSGGDKAESIYKDGPPNWDKSIKSYLIEPSNDSYLGKADKGKIFWYRTFTPSADFGNQFDLTMYAKQITSWVSS